MKVKLPISKSIANRILLLQAIHGDPLMRVSSDMPDDVLVLHDALQKIRDTFGTPNDRITPPFREGQGVGLSLNLKNCGTALRFLQVHIAKCYPGAPITLTGDPRLMERDGKPTTQTTSALILHGEDIPVTPDESPYITLSRRIKEAYEKNNSLPFTGEELCSIGLPVAVRRTLQGLGFLLESCWSSASYWYEYVAIHGGELLLEGLQPDSLQGDRIVAELYAKYFGVETEFIENGAIIHKKGSPPFTGEELCSIGLPVAVRRTLQGVGLSLDFTNCPDLYPAIALTCEKLSIDLIATGTDRLRHKESDRIEAVRLHEVRNDHRMAMALMAADFITLDLTPETALDSTPDSNSQAENDLKKIIAKSYPQFTEIFSQITAESRRSTDGQPTVKANVSTPTITHITPIRGVNDDNLGKKHALSKLIHAATTEYVWLHDDDVVLPKAAKENSFPLWVKSSARSDCRWPSVEQSGVGLYILPLRMESSLPSGRVGVGSLLQIAEYAAIQELTMRTAQSGHAVMCSGANLIVRREAWLECEPDLHPEIPSGDDMFLLEAMKKRGYKISVIDEPDFTAVVRPQTTWRAFFRQRMRWAGKAPKYTDSDILRCGALIVAANLLQLLCPLILLIKFPIEYSLIRHREALYTIHHTPYTKEPRTKWYVALLLEILYPFYLLICLIGGLFRKSW